MDKIKEKILDFYCVKKHVYWSIGIGSGILLLIIIIIILAIIFKRYDYSEVEAKMVASAKQYLSAHKEYIPNANLTEYVINANSLINEEYLKEFEKLSKDTNCSGNVTVTYNNGSLRYKPQLFCDNYETPSLIDTILKNENIVTENDGLYKTNETYRYKGDYVSNYLNFAEKKWRIFKIENHLIYIILADTINTKNSETMYDDRYNIDSESSKGNSDFDSSRIKDTLNNIYQNEFSKYHGYILTHDACKHTRSEIDTDFTGAIECFTTTKTPISLMAVYDFLTASHDRLCLKTMFENCSNYNYLTVTKNKWWLLNGTNENTYKVYYVKENGKLALDYANSKKNLRYVLTIPEDIIYKSGNGTSESPYEVFTY